METLDVVGLPPPINSEMFGFDEITEAQIGIMFDDISRRAVEQPDNNDVQAELVRLIVEVRDSGSIEYAMQMAMTVGAMACAHSHLSKTSSVLEGVLFDPSRQPWQQDQHDQSDSAHDDHGHNGESNGCQDCSPRSRCKKHKN